MFGAPVPISGPQAAPGRRGLLVSTVASGTQSDDVGPRPDPDQLGDVGPRQPAWVGGFTIEPDICGALDPTLVECFPDTTKGSLTNPVNPTYSPFLTYGFDRCSAADRHRDREGRARRNLLATESWQIEREFFDGVATKAKDDVDTPDNPFLTDGNATNVTVGSPNAVVALAQLEKRLLDCLHGQRGMIHAAGDLVTMWQNGGALRLEGNIILTVLDTIVVPGSGYSGNDPDGVAASAGTSWAYGTPLVYLRQGVVMNPSENDPASSVDREQNTITLRVERPNAVYHSPCCVLAVHAALT